MYIKVCVGCGNTFETKTAQRKRCRKDCGRASGASNASRAFKRATNDIEFIGVDGEGVGRPDGEHHYVMLSVGAETLMNDDGSELTYLQIFPFLYDQYQRNPDAAFIGFYLGYDFTQWTKHLPEPSAYQLYAKKAIEARKPKRSKNPDPFPVYVDTPDGGWEVDIMTKRRFRLRRHDHRPSKLDPTVCRVCRTTLDYLDMTIREGETDWNDYIDITIDECVDTWSVTWWEQFDPQRRRDRRNSWMYICDTGSFWQMSLMSAINPKDWPTPICTQDEYERLKGGKATRARIVPYGDVTEFEEMRLYNILENDVLARMTRELNRGFMDIGLQIRAREWYGPGRAAQTWLDHVCKEMPDGHTVKRVDVMEHVPEFAREAGRKSYYGGWFEQFFHGLISPTVYECDINSAYPWVIASLPCLLHGEWSEIEWNDSEEPPYRDDALYILNCHVVGSDPYIGAMPWRSPNGRILRPHETEGWYWKHELDMARSAGLIDRVSVRRYVEYVPCDCLPPLRSIADLYSKRLAVGKKSPQGKALKLIYNSAYGKTAQSVGTPKYANAIYASLITAGCRTRILEAIATHPQGSSAVTMVATDGIYFTSDHPTIDVDSDRLGAWDRSRKYGLTQFMPGVYWDDAIREVLETEKRSGIRADKLPSKTRGINVRDLADCIEALDNQFVEFYRQVALSNGVPVWPQFSVTVNFDMVSATQAIARGKWNTAGRVTTGGTRTIQSIPSTKRLHTQDAVYHESGVGIRSSVIARGVPVESTPYDRQFGTDLETYLEMTSNQTPDGDFFDVWGFMMSGDMGTDV